MKKIKKRDYNVLAAAKGYVKMSTSVVPPKKGKGTRYNRAKMKVSQEAY